MSTQRSELTVITRAKELCSCVMTVTQKSPKQFRFTFVSRMQNLALDAIEHLYRANDTFATRDVLFRSKTVRRVIPPLQHMPQVNGYCGV